MPPAEHAVRRPVGVADAVAADAGVISAWRVGGENMWRRFSATILLMLVLGASGSGFETKEIPLPSIVGSYGCAPATLGTCTFAVEQSFRLEGVPVNVSRVSIRLTGSAHRGSYWCDFGQIPMESGWGFSFHASMADSVTNGRWDASWTPGQDGTFEVELEFTTTSGATWGFLGSAGGTVRLAELQNKAIESLACYYYDHPSAVIDTATLVVESTTWSAIKALYSK